ncbi:hypothetical protein DM01DRAFT_1371597 [Hesseltinella vesiculosa]|uniref:Uncharacterized protein n=1 Tax=Hesseltinella vesiculosa TaxID=101127 RepID=A0A1X2GRV8_9FUNG|nr:hypothetical protein DM01DRAFT_1371597 [Hesseltinella vesiculosa]
MALNIAHDNLQEPVTIHSLARVQDIHRAFLRLPLASPTETVPLAISLQLRDDPYTIIPATNADQSSVCQPDHAIAFMKEKVATSWIPKLLDKAGSHVEPFRNVLEALNFDFRR